MPLTSQGYVKRTASEIKEDLVNSLRQTIPEFTEQNADIQSNLLDTSIEAILQYENMMNALFNAYSPSYANDDMFMKFAESLGLRQKKEFKAQATITFKGKYGDFIPKGTIITDEEGTNEFTTQDNVVCDTTGTANALALSEAEDIFEANTITKIKTIVGGNITATNQVASLKYISTETTASLKARAQAKLRSVRQGGKMYADSLLRGLDGVDRRLIAFYDRTITFTQENKNYFIKGIEAVVGGGTDSEVAKCLYLSFLETQKLISMPSDDVENRKKNVTLYVYENPVNIEFTRPKVLELHIKCLISFTSSISSPVALQQLTQTAVTNYVNALQVGIGVNKYSLIEIIMPIIVDAGMPSHTIKDIDFQYKIGEDGKLGKFNSDGFISEIEHDCYCVLNGYSFEINS